MTKVNAFDEIKRTDYAPVRKAIVIKTSKGDSLTFYANELSYTQKVRLAGISVAQGDELLHWIVSAITDEDDQKMSLEQAKALPDEIVQKFLDAVIQVTTEAEGLEDTKSSKKKSKPRRRNMV